MRRHRWWWAAAAATLLVVTAGLPVYVFPRQTAPVGADVVFVIGPPRAWRIAWARELVAAGKARAIMISQPETGSLQACAAQSTVPVLCRRPDPFTTRGEARWLRDEMAAHGWRTAVVITSTPHIARTRYVMQRCVPSGVQVVGRTTGMAPWTWVYQYAYQTAAWVKALAQCGC
ncbi:MAG: hypothetical protein B7X40_06075 [Cellulomonas sp. 14-74-6]|nr:MAG: hypothetical protein B7X40_06075 [Cellulomonas sp. 14-74-6]